MKRTILALVIILLLAIVLLSIRLLRSSGGETVYQSVDIGPANISIPDEKAPALEDYLDSIAGKDMPEEKVVIPSPPPPKGFALHSVFFVKGQESTRGFAAIEVDRTERLYTKSDELPGGYKLVIIAERHVILQKADSRYRLDIDGSAPKTVEPRTEAGEGPPSAKLVNVPAEEPDFNEVEPVEFFDDSGSPADLIYVPKEVFNYAVKNLHKLLHDVRVRTDLTGEQGAMTGVKIDPKRNSLPHKLGFRSGDIIRSVDGDPMTSIKDIMDLYQRYSGETPERIRVKYERDGEIRIRVIELGD